MRSRPFQISLFLLPAAAFFIAFVVYPVCQTLVYGLYKWQMAWPQAFVGLSNYQKLVQDPVFWGAFSHNIYLVLASLGTQIPLGLFLAILLSRPYRGRNFFRTMFFSPMVLSPVIIGVLWGYIYNPSFGLLNSLLKFVGLGSFAQAWLSTPRTVLGAIFLTLIWQYTGFYMVLFMAGIEGIPKAIFDACKVDGANAWQEVWHVTLPSLKGTIRTAILLILIGSLKYFPLVWVMTRGGPMHASEVMATYMYKKTFMEFQFGYGASIAWGLFFLSLMVTLLTSRMLYRMSKVGA